MRNPRDELPSVARRISAARMLSQGASVEEVASALRLSVQTVRRYRSIFDVDGLEGLRDMRLGGKAPALDAQALAWLSAAIEGSARAHGFSSDRWTNARVRELIAARFGVRHSRVHTWQILTDLGIADRLSKSAL